MIGLNQIKPDLEYWDDSFVEIIQIGSKLKIFKYYFNHLNKFNIELYSNLQNIPKPFIKIIDPIKVEWNLIKKLSIQCLKLDPNAIYIASNIVDDKNILEEKRLKVKQEHIVTSPIYVSGETLERYYDRIFSTYKGIDHYLDKDYEEKFSYLLRNWDIATFIEDSYKKARDKYPIEMKQLWSFLDQITDFKDEYKIQISNDLKINIEDINLNLQNILVDFKDGELKMIVVDIWSSIPRIINSKI